MLQALIFLSAIEFSSRFLCPLRIHEILDGAFKLNERTAPKFGICDAKYLS